MEIFIRLVRCYEARIRLGTCWWVDACSSGGRRECWLGCAASRGEMVAVPPPSGFPRASSDYDRLQYRELMTTDDTSLVQTASRLGRTAGATIPGPLKAVGTTFLPML